VIDYLQPAALGIWQVPITPASAAVPTHLAGVSQNGPMDESQAAPSLAGTRQIPLKAPVAMSQSPPPVQIAYVVASTSPHGDPGVTTVALVHFAVAAGHHSPW
jgi:hypothetical protein